MEVVGMVVVVASMMVVVGVGEGAVYKVGDSAGWTTIANVDYKQWAASKSFRIGDTVVFEYNPQFHNVMRVTHPMYRSCNGTTPLATFTTGNDSISLTNHGHHFFFCGVPGHCQAGQKVDIHVLPIEGDSASPTPQPTSPSDSPTPTVPAAGVHGPSPSPAAYLSSPALLAFAPLLLSAFLPLSRMFM